MKTNTRFWFSPLLLGLVFAFLTLIGCSGDDGAPGQDVDPATVDNLQSQIDALKLGSGESCAVCHSGDGAIVLSGPGHQAEYNKYTDTSAYTLTINSVVSTPLGTVPETYDSVMTFTITYNGLPYDNVVDPDLGDLNQKRYYASLYDSTANRHIENFSYGSPAAAAGAGQYTVTASGVDFAPESSNAQVYALIADNTLDTEGMTLYSDVAEDGVSYGDANTYASTANNSACETCHGVPYMKHGYRSAVVNGLPDFGACKSCHNDTTNGTHPDWQLLKDDPAQYAVYDAAAKACDEAGDSTCDSIRENMTAEELAKYAYTRRVMNDVHMAHNMEFPYPQKMLNCNTCHEGNLGSVLTNANYKAETCKSCHAVESLIAKMQTNRAGNPVTIHDSTVIPALRAGNYPLPAVPPDPEYDCNSCHNGSIAVSISSIHNGYDPEIYDAAGNRYADAFPVTVDAASFDAATNVLTFEFSATEAIPNPDFDPADIVPQVLIGLYGYNTKDFIVYGHERVDGVAQLEYNVDGTNANPRFTTVAAGGGAWEITVNLSEWADMIADGTIMRAEIIVLPALGVNGPLDTRGGTGEYADDEIRAMNAPSRTFDLGANAFDDTFFTAIVDETGCNTCHDAMGIPYHDGKRGGNIKACRFCHNVNNGGSHLEMQSRSIDSYVHAVHSFQAFDIGDIDFTDPVEALHYEHHIAHTYPNFTIKNCESCHNPGTYGVPDQSKSMAGVLSASDDVAGRNIGNVPSVVTGPAERACGACHKAAFIKADDAGGLAALNAHTAQFGYRIEDDDDVWDRVVEAIMSMF